MHNEHITAGHGVAPPSFDALLRDLDWCSQQMHGITSELICAAERLPGQSRAARRQMQRAASKGRHQQAFSIALDHLGTAIGALDGAAARLEAATSRVLGIHREAEESPLAFIKRVVDAASTPEGILAALGARHGQQTAIEVTP